MPGNDSERMRKFRASVGPLKGTYFYGSELQQHKALCGQSQPENFQLRGGGVDYKNNQEIWYVRGARGIEEGSILSFLGCRRGREVVRRERVVSRDDDVVVTQPVPVKPDSKERVYIMNDNGYLRTNIVARCHACQTARKRTEAAA
jgi:hypothetical protein